MIEGYRIPQLGNGIPLCAFSLKTDIAIFNSRTRSLACLSFSSASTIVNSQLGVGIFLYSFVLPSLDRFMYDPSMTDDVYEKALTAALEDLKSLQRQQMEIEKKIVSTKQIVVSLKVLLGKKGNIDAGLGLKDACLQVLHGNLFQPMTVPQIVDGLQKIGFEISGYANPSSVVKNTLERLANDPKTDVKAEMRDGKKTYTDVPF